MSDLLTLVTPHRLKGKKYTLVCPVHGDAAEAFTQEDAERNAVNHAAAHIFTENKL